LGGSALKNLKHSLNTFLRCVYTRGSHFCHEICFVFNQTSHARTAAVPNQVAAVVSFDNSSRKAGAQKQLQRTRENA
jgi:hypothetical protein